MNLTEEEHIIREYRIADSKAHTYPLTHQQVADLIGVSRSHYCRVLNRGCWFELDLYKKVISIDIDWYLKEYPDVMKSNLVRMGLIVKHYPKAQKFMNKYS